MTETEAAPTCYRHTDRETYVRCTRCDRPICPDCMNEAAVGFQCPECVKEGRKTVRQARTVFGGRAGADANVTKVLLAVNVVAFVAQLTSSGFTDRFAMHGISVAFFDDYYRMVTSAFLHSPGIPLHILFNMYVLYGFGSQVERLLGGVRYLVLYLVAAIGGSVATLYFVHPDVPSLGASGAVFGLFGAAFVLARKMRADTSQLVMVIGINFVFGFVLPNVNNFAHAGGLVAGAAVAFVYAHAPRGPRQALLQYGGAALVTLVLVIATVARVNAANQSPARFLSSASRVSATSVAEAPSR